MNLAIILMASGLLMIVALGLCELLAAPLVERDNDD